MFSKPAKPNEAVKPVPPEPPAKPSMVYDTKGYNEVSPSIKQLKNIFKRTPKVWKYTDDDTYIPHSEGGTSEPK